MKNDSANLYPYLKRAQVKSTLYIQPRISQSATIGLYQLSFRHSTSKNDLQLRGLTTSLDLGKSDRVKEFGAVNFHFLFLAKATIVYQPTTLSLKAQRPLCTHVELLTQPPPSPPYPPYPQLTTTQHQSHNSHLPP